MVKDASLNAECKVIKVVDLPSHTVFFGEVLEVSASGSEPLAYHKGKYWRMSETLPKPTDEESEKFKGIIEKYKR